MEATGFQMAMVLVGALFAVINLLIGIILKHMLDEQRAQRAIMREIETKYFPRDEFQRFEDRTIDDRHSVKERVGALEIRLGAWEPGAKSL